MLNLHKIEIKGLFGRTNISVPIKDNKLVLVGYNGIGKSTVLNAFYFFVSCQWHKLSEIDFKEVKIRAGNRSLKIKKDELKEHLENSNYRRFAAKKGFPSRSMTLRARKEAETLPQSILDRILSRHASHNSLVRLLVTEFGYPASISSQLVHYIRARERQLVEPVANVDEIERFLNEKIEGRIIFLPTYRRIEKDIKAIFPEIEDEIQHA
jgi:predicted ATP-dependent endonuclease of OLD family